MLADARGTIVVSSMGWVDGGNLWVFRTSSGNATTARLSDAKYLSLHPGDGDHFSVAHHTESSRIAITIHHVSEPETVLGSAIVDDDANRVIGGADVWARVPYCYTTFYAGPSLRDYVLVRVLAREGRVDLQTFDWFTSDAYDRAYQGIVSAAQVPGHDVVLVSVQRSSRVIVHDPVAGREVGAFDIGDRRGNPTLYFRRNANELWADDYDALVKIEPGSWRVLGSRALQPPSGSVSQFIGKFAFDADETMCAVPRPYSRDVIAIDPADLQTRFRCPMLGQPLEAIALPDRSVIARDWKTGRLLRGDLR
ncbi:MAG TPA: hypothetical protein VEU08_10585 [Vicinamibacterales bacterium]|nr:hypothetical protein [Vicinamibacterales bacterium]